MSQQDFLGTWIVSLSAGTPFGFGTAITLSGGTNPGISFDPPVNQQGSKVGYDDGLDMVEVTGIEGLSSPLYLAVYKDPEDASYAALYGIAIASVSGSSGEVTAMPTTAVVTFAAVAQQAPTTSTSGGSPTATLPAHDVIIRASGGTQFGRASRLGFESGDPEVTATLVNGLGDSVPTPTLEWIGPATLQGVYQGAGAEDRLVMQCSFVTIDGVQRCFGLAVVGDPENSGVWGGDEEEPPQTSE